MALHLSYETRQRRARFPFWSLGERRWINRRMFWTICAAMTVAAAATAALVDLASNLPRTIYDPVVGGLTSTAADALAHACRTCALWALGGFAASSGLALAGLKSAGVGIERRGRPERRPLRVAVHVDRPAGKYEASSENISVGGLLLATDEEHAVGEKIRLRFQLPHQEATLSVDAEVRWVRRAGGVQGARPTGVGLLFLSPDWEFRVGLRRFLALGRRS